MVGNLLTTIIWRDTYLRYMKKRSHLNVKCATAATLLDQPHMKDTFLQFIMERSNPLIFIIDKNRAKFVLFHSSHIIKFENSKKFIKLQNVFHQTSIQMWDMSLLFFKRSIIWRGTINTKIRKSMQTNKMITIYCHFQFKHSFFVSCWVK